jgi:dTDP-4-amino-4,6-dideoxygalactose transaminase
MIPLHRPWIGAEEEAAALRVLRSGVLAGNGPECAALERELGDLLDIPQVLAVSSATHALELSMRLLGVEGGEVILPSFTFPSVANAVLAAGGTIRFCEIREPDLNADLDHARSLITPSTRAIVVTHYAGHGQPFDGLPVPVVEDAAHALGSRVAGRPCGTTGTFGCLSFHATKNVTGGEGGALLVRDPAAARQARVMREKGTNRDDQVAGRIAHYTWVAVGSSLVMPEIAAAIVRAQMAKLGAILEARERVACLYDAGLRSLVEGGRIAIVRPVPEATSSWHVYGVRVDPGERDAVIARMAAMGVQAASHFEPLHASPYGRAVAPRLSLPRTERLASSLVRLPIYPGLSDAAVQRVIESLQTSLETHP